MARRKWTMYFGEVLSQVAGTDEWYSVKYEEDDVLTLSLHEDMDLGRWEIWK